MKAADLQATAAKAPVGGHAGQGEVSRSVLIVDDEPSVRHLMRRWLESRGYTVVVAPGAEAALDVLAVTPAAVALCDLRMPGRDGHWLTEQIRRAHPETAVIIATAVNDTTDGMDHLRRGVVDYLTKPFERDRLCQAVTRAADWHRAAWDARRWREQLESEMQSRQAHLAEVIASQYVSSDEDLDILLATLTATNPEAYAHAHRVAELSAALARALGLSDPEVDIVARGALLHDLGKLTMPEALLRKPAPLTSEEQRLIRQLPSVGSSLIERVPYLAAAVPVVRDAHERVDGQGYPRGSQDEDVWLGSRIVAVADAFDTMIRARVFRDAISKNAAIEELQRCAGTQFDPRVVHAFTAVVDARG